MRQIAEIIDGDLAVPLPELGATERPAVVNLAYRRNQTFSQSLAQLQPLTKFGPLKATKAARDEAQERMRVAAFWDQEDRTPLLDAQRGRYLFAYGTSPVRVSSSGRASFASRVNSARAACSGASRARRSSRCMAASSWSTPHTAGP